ncbi:MAG: hypothetical protein ACPGJE_00530 [Wenzhouxiangellaceae bacterium]
MKKLLIGLIVLALLLALLLPAGVGLLLQSRGQAALVEDMPEARIDWQRGWTRSRVEMETESWRAMIRLRHAPLSPPGWLAGDGRVTLFEPPAVFDVQAHVTPAIGLRGSAEAPSIRIDGPVGWSAEQPRVAIEALAERTFSFDAAIASVLGADGLGNRLALNQTALEIDVRPEDTRFDRAAVDLRLTRAGHPPSHLRLRISRIDHQALVLLLQSVEQLIAAEPDSAAASLAMVGVLSAWSELAAAGVTVDLESLVIDGELRLNGRWTPATREFVLEGGGPAELALDWAAAVIGLGNALAPEAARAGARALLEELVVEQDGVSVNSGSISVRIGPV